MYIYQRKMLASIRNIKSLYLCENWFVECVSFIYFFIFYFSNIPEWKRRNGAKWNEVTTMRVHFACENSEVSFFCLPKLLPLNSVLWLCNDFSCDLGDDICSVCRWYDARIRKPIWTFCVGMMCAMWKILGKTHSYLMLTSTSAVKFPNYISKFVQLLLCY